MSRDASRESRSGLNPETWPVYGRVGLCRAGRRQGSFVFAHLGTSDRVPELAFWQIFFTSPMSDSVEELWVDHVSGLAEADLQSCDIEWAPDELDAGVEDSVFGLRRWMQGNGSMTYASFSPPAAHRAIAPALVDIADPWRWWAS